MRREIGEAVRGQMQAAANLSEARLRSAASQASSVAAQQQAATAEQEKQAAESLTAAATATANAERERLDIAVAQIDVEVTALMRNLGVGEANDGAKVRDKSADAIERVNTEIMALSGETLDAHATVGQLRQRLKGDATLRGKLLNSAGVDTTG
jgi:hypothetical protein